MAGHLSKVRPGSAPVTRDLAACPTIPIVATPSASARDSGAQRVAHAHDWQPIEGRRARYACSTCPAHGYRPDGGGEIRATTDVNYRSAADPTVRPVAEPGLDEHPIPRSRKPSLDETERQRRMR